MIGKCMNNKEHCRRARFYSQIQHSQIKTSAILIAEDLILHLVILYQIPGWQKITIRTSGVMEPRSESMLLQINSRIVRNNEWKDC